ncbi:urease accessory protein [Eremomyces bilateralis CBS 781.70]|uniref:Urease accessory protein n=1 Tax=Eremomyces bilateralis CBS 781.70 TaxID=1392243 RepID=A0A6G1GCZ1_9PEZI|nr:urease accessory protein [Eremomyces bilateralis CBS 781.70]KAF1815729.1 urease accessory protein [Eremomyces bilateralis CBS 781.70]
MTSPFPTLPLGPGVGEITLHPLRTAQPALQSLRYQYPLKLVAPAPSTVSSPPSSPPTTHLVHTIFLLTYGGGLVAGDVISLHVSLAAAARLVLLTQGSTKVYKAPSGGAGARQRMEVALRDDAMLCYLPDPVQPFAKSAFEQAQVYVLHGAEASLCVADWVAEGRRARGERWGFGGYGSRNEVWGCEAGGGGRRLLVRDNVFLTDKHGANGDFAAAVDGLGAVGTLILGGPGFRGVGRFFMEEFQAMPRVGGKKWDGSEGEEEETGRERWRARRLKEEGRDGVLWTAADVRGFVLVKFGAREVEGVKVWLRNMLREEGTVEATFGERALLCMK